MTGVLDNGYQVVWIHERSFSSLSGINQRVIGRSDIYLSIDIGMESSKV